MTASDLLRRDKQLVEWWVLIVHDPRFDQVAALVRASLAENPIDKEQMTGANLAIDTFRTISDGDEGTGGYPSPGLIHNLTATRPPEKKEISV